MPKSDPRTVRVPFKVVDGCLTYLYGGSLPTLRNGASGELVLPAFAVSVPEVRERLLAEKVVPLLEASTLLLVRISNKSIPPTLASGYREETLKGRGRTLCVEVVLRKPLAICWRGIKLGKLEPVNCDIPALPRKRAESLNHASRLVSEAFEPHRRSHSANVFEEVFVQRGKGWVPLGELRSEVETRLEASLLLGDKR